MLASEKHYGEASWLQRLGTYLVDGFCISLVAGRLAAFESLLTTAGNLSVLQSEVVALITGLAVFVAYYVALEVLFGRTVGKMILGTRVISDRGTHATFKGILLRTLVRLVPFEPVSFWFSRGWWHDVWTGTEVVRTRPGKWQQDPTEVL